MVVMVTIRGSTDPPPPREWLRLVFPPKILAIVPEFLLGKVKRVQELFDAPETTFKLRPYQYHNEICHDLVNSSTLR